MTHGHRSGLLLVLALLALSGCSTVTRLGNPELPYPPPRPLQIGDILHLPTGLFVDRDRMLAAVSDARVVYVGETHDNLASHRLELEILQALAERYPGRVALGMEMLTPDQQEVLDAWIAGRLNEKEFIKQSRWLEVWRLDFRYYRDLLEFAREHKIPLLGLNAGKDLVSAIGHSEPGQLEPDLQSRLPEMDLNDPYQSALVKAFYGGHTAGKAMLAGFQRVQTLWDETMAQNAAAWLQNPDHEGMHLMVMAGGNHIRNGFGIPRRVFRRIPTSYVLVGTRELSIPEGLEDREMQVQLPEFPMPAYDYLAFTDYEVLPEGVKLGVMLGEDDSGVLVQAVVPGSAAERAGLKAGDRILRLDGEEMPGNFDLIYAVQQRKPGDRGLLTFERDGEEQEVEVIFSVPEVPADHHHPKK